MSDEIKPIQEEVEHDTTSVNEHNISQLARELENFKELIKDHLEKQIEQNRFKDETINRLQKTISEYEKGLVSKIKEPLIWNLIFFKDSFEKFWEKYEGVLNLPTSEIDLLFEELEEIFYSHGLERINAESKYYDREKQIVRKKEKTVDPEENMLVSKVLKTGYILDGKILRKEEISVKVFEQEEGAADTNSQQ